MEYLEGGACSLHAALCEVELCQRCNIDAGCAGCCADRAQARPDVPFQACGVSLQCMSMSWSSSLVHLCAGTGSPLETKAGVQKGTRRCRIS